MVKAGIKARVKDIKGKTKFPLMAGYFKKRPIKALHRAKGFVKEMPHLLEIFWDKGRIAALQETLKVCKNLKRNGNPVEQNIPEHMKGKETKELVDDFKKDISRAFGGKGYDD